MRSKEPHGPPPTVGQLRSQGVAGFVVTCDRCRHSSDLMFDAMAIPGDLAFPAIRSARRFVCTGCGGRAVHVMPDWRGVNARSNGEKAAVPRIMPP